MANKRLTIEKIYLYACKNSRKEWNILLIIYVCICVWYTCVWNFSQLWKDITKMGSDPVLVLLQLHARRERRKKNKKIGSVLFLKFFNSETERRLRKPTEGNTSTALTIRSEGIATDHGRSYAQDSLNIIFFFVFLFL